jgi:hypothetical protein
MDRPCTATASCNHLVRKLPVDPLSVYPLTHNIHPRLNALPAVRDTITVEPTSFPPILAHPPRPIISNTNSPFARSDYLSRAHDADDHPLHPGC